MDLDAVMLARIQFAFTVAFHIIFPAFTIGLSAWIATLLVMWVRTDNERYRLLARFWTRIFAVSFAMGVVSGIVLSYQFGTNWSRFSEVVGNVVGPLIGYEVLTAFFLEATFLGILLFGWDRFPRWLHVTAGILVALGTLMSAFWILAANSWMHSPAGHAVADGIAYPVDWFAVIFNPTFPYRLVHMVVAAYLTTSFVVIAVGARYLLAGMHRDQALTMLRMGLGMAVVLAPAQAVIGDFHGLKTLEYQPAKIAALEAHWHERPGPLPLVLFAIPNEREERNDYEIAVPWLGSLILTHTLDGTYPALSSFPVEDRPPVLLPFYGFRLMVGIGLVLIAMAVWGTWLWYRRRLEASPRYLKLAAMTWPLGFIAILAGWTVTEVGRQPWVAHGILRTADAASPVSAGSVATSLALFVVIYTIVFSAGIYYINRLIVRGPQPSVPGGPRGLPNRPLSGASTDDPALAGGAG
ncbi:MAG TPA: cytochrome ubiquinol oxidase subunit I [Afifellaceae bacterium]|nr:cytochrome ubiquinol oxidase subunit I [Afifellaceae bacterium]